MKIASIELWIKHNLIAFYIKNKKIFVQDINQDVQKNSFITRLTKQNGILTQNAISCLDTKEQQLNNYFSWWDLKLKPLIIS